MDTFQRGEFADKLSDLIHGSGYSIARIAQDIGISSGALSNYQSDKSTAGIDSLFALAKYFNVSADWLIGTSKVQPPNLDIQAVGKLTGLNDKAISSIAHITGLSDEISEIINSILENEECLIMLALFIRDMANAKCNKTNDLTVYEKIMQLYSDKGSDDGSERIRGDEYIALLQYRISKQMISLADTISDKMAAKKEAD